MLGFAALSAKAAPTYLTYQGRIVKPNGQALEHNNVSFLFEITSSNGSCVLYREQVDGVNMQNSNGVFDVPIGNSHSYPAAPSFTILDAFNNSGGLTCFGGTPFSPTLSSGRLLRVQFHDGTAWRLISPDSAIRSVPYAGHAESSNKLGGHLADQFVLKSEINLGADCKSGFFLTWDAASRTFGCAADAAGAGGGLSSLNGQTGATQTFSPLATATSYGFGSSGNVHTLTIPSASTAGVTAGTISKSEFDAFSAKQAPGNYIVTLSGDVTSSLYSAGTVTTTIANNAVTTVKIADGAITGQKLENSGVSAGTYSSVTVDAKGRVTAGGTLASTDIPNLDASKITTGTLTRDVSAANVTATNIRIYDGVSQYLTMRLPPGGTGYTLNWPNAVGAAGSILQTDASGNLSWVTPPSAPVSSVAGRTGAVTLSNTDISGLGTAATRNVPSSGDAAAAEVVLGNDTRLSGPRAPNGSAGGDLSGTYPNPTVAKIQTRAMSNTAPLDGQVILWDNGNTTWTPQYVRMQDIRNTWGGTAMLPSTLCTADQAMVWNSLVDRFTCQNIGSLDAAAITTGVLAAARLGTGTADNTKYLRGDGTWQTLSTSDATKLPLAGGQMSGDIDMNTHKIINASNIPWTAVNPGGSNDMQSLRWDDTAKEWKWFTAGAAGAGIATINGANGTAQTLAPTASATSYGFTTSSNTHTFSIPSASGAGVTAGTISKTEYDSFAAKQAAGNYATALAGDVTSTGYSAGTLTTAIATNAVTTAKINDGAVTGVKLEDVSGLIVGTYPKVTVDAKGRVTTGAALSATDIPDLDAAKITTGVFSVARLATGTPDGSKFLRDDGTWAALPNLGSGYVLKTGDTMTGPLQVNSSSTAGLVSRGFGVSVPGTIDLSGALGTAGSPGKVANGAEIGRVSFSGYVRNPADTADAYTPLASIRAKTVNMDAQGRAGGGFGFFSSYFGSGSEVERMTFLPPSNLGIGNTNPQVEIHIGNLGGSIQIGADATTNRNFYMMNSSVSALRAFDIGNGNASGGGTVLARFQNDGKVGIGVANPTERLDVGGKVKATEFCIGATCISSWPSGGSGSVTSVVAGSGLTGGTITTTGTLAVDVGTNAGQIPQLNVSGKLPAAVIPTDILTTSTTLGGDLSGSLPNPTVVKIQGQTVANTVPSTSGQVLVWDQSTTRWTVNNIRAQDISTIWGGTQIIPSSSCGAHQAMVWSTITDRMTCQNIGSLDAAAVTTGTFATGRLGTGTADNTKYLRGDGTWAAISVSETDPKVGANTTNYVSKWDGSALVASGISEVSGNVGIGIASASNPLEIQKNHNGETFLVMRNTNTGNASEVGITIENNAGAAGSIFSTSFNYSSVTAYQDRFNIVSTPNVTGLTLAAENGDMRFLTTGQTERMRLTAAGDFGIGTTNPGAKLEVGGQIKITGGSPGLGKVLTSNATGLATWQNPATSGTVTSITAGTGLTGGTITGSGTIGLGTELTGLNGLSTNGFVKRTGAGAYSTVSSVTLTSEVTGVLPIANGGTNSSTALNSNRLMASISGAIQELGAMADGQVVVGKNASAPQIVTLGGDATISNTGSLTLGTGSVNSAKISDGTVGVVDLNFTGTMTTNTGIVVRDGTQFHNKTCSANQVLIWTVSNGWACNSLVLTETDPKVGSNTTNYVSKWNGTALVASGIFENGSGNIGIGTTSPGYKLQVNTTSAEVGAWDVASAFNYTFANPTATSATRFIGQINGTENGNTAAITGEIIGQVNYANNSMPSALNKLSGSWHGVKNNNGAGAVTTAVGVQGQIENASTNTIATAMGLQSSILKTSSGANTNGFGLYVGNIQATNAWSVYASDATAPSYFAGSVGVGTVSPAVKLDVVGGSAAVDNSFLIKKTNSASNRYNAVEINPWVYDSTSTSEDTALLIATKINGTTSNVAEFGSENYFYTPTNFDGSWTYLRRDGNNANGPWLYGEKFRGSFGTKGAVASGDDLLNIGGLGYNSSGTNNLGALISFQATEAYTNAAGGAKIYFATTPNGNTSFQTRMTIDQTGFVGIGTTSPSNTLHVTQAAAGVVARFANSAGSCTLTPSSSAANWACTSDASLKENVQNISGEEALDKMLGLNAVTYTLKKGDDGSRHTGYIAQNVRDVAPEFVRQDESGILQVSYTGFIPWITEGLKALHLKVKNLIDIQAAQSRELASQGQAILLLEKQNREKSSEIEALKKESEDLKARFEKLEKHLAK
ncbi:hypothetical protein AZI86_11995 [Bdellovibrio bacteriovorus]|uniref:Peptidase S74 domain-containing protein n=1 Tax=Bdellovibrio bacteriovorus TaxID=959 RepID=A0A150WLV2_BDEBC|nr:tail fiber domain-containing protein [Bdellovibrio bacteriovorus]KYG64914.1 hypothetical protein AZI86_11995 [Bdellovibrio bacteriovorus]